MFYLMLSSCFSFFFFNDTATTEIYTLSLHDALPICKRHNLFVPICLTYLHEASVVGRVLLICLLCDSVSLWPISHDAKRLRNIRRNSALSRSFQRRRGGR